MLTAVGAVALALSVWNFPREVESVGFGPGPLLAVALATALTSGIVHSGLALARSELRPRDEWTIVGASVAGGSFTTASQALTVAVRAVESRDVSEPLFPILVIGSLGTLGGLLIGQQYVESRRDRSAAERSRNAIAFTNSLPRHDVRNDLEVIDGRVSVLADHDDGPGIPSGDREAAFERGTSRDGGGHGLYVARTIVDAFDGEIIVEDSDLGCAAFVVTLPLADDRNTDDGADRWTT